MTMQNAQCFECGKPASHAHHVVPRSEGGTRTVPLCSECHGKVHGIDYTNHGELTCKGLKKAAAVGRVGGRPPALTRKEVFQIADAMKSEKTRKSIADDFGICKATLYRYVSPDGNILKLPPPEDSLFE